jgi:uncharacterized protein (DUF362 family)
VPVPHQTEEDATLRIPEEAGNELQQVIVAHQVEQLVYMRFSTQRRCHISVVPDCFGATFVLECEPLLSDIGTNRHDSVVVFRETKPGQFILRADLWFPRTVLEADFVISLPKVKTHHWSGVTLSMKNMFGVVPGAKYGWPKNILHWKGIQESILDICATVPIHFVIADAVIAMEGNGPLNGSPRLLNRIILADDPVAADATCARLMGLNPERIEHIQVGAEFLGNSSAARIDQLAEPISSPRTPFSIVPEFEYLREKCPSDVSPRMST